jgi:hypothetical protein
LRKKIHIPKRGACMILLARSGRYSLARKF